MEDDDDTLEDDDCLGCRGDACGRDTPSIAATITTAMTASPDGWVLIPNERPNISTPLSILNGSAVYTRESPLYGR